MEKSLDFETVIERNGTGCLKYDGRAMRGMPADVLPLWVADMDFRVSSSIQEALTAQAAHGIYGYAQVQDSYYEAVRGWMKRRHQWDTEPDWIVTTPGVVFALAMAVRAFTEPGDAVLIQKPVYYPFDSVIRNNGRRTVSNTLVMDENGRYSMDLEDFEEKVVREKIRLFFLCNPHNPVGRVWSREELEAVGDICRRHNVIVASDEIHADFVHVGRHRVFMDLKEEYRNMTVTCTAPSKTFNIAGLQISNIFIADEGLRKRFRRQITATGYDEPNMAGLAACEAAYRDGETWYAAMLAYVRENIAYIREFLAARIPRITMTEPEGTYLVWLDCRKLGLSGEALNRLFVGEAKLWLDDGTIFGETGEGFQRVNTACPRATLREALERLARAAALR